MLLTQFIDYLQLEKKYSKHTVMAYSKDITFFKEFVFIRYDEKDLSNIQYVQIREWIVSLSKNGLTTRSINRKLSALNSFYKFLQKTSVIASNPLIGHKSLKIKKKIITPFSIKELEKIRGQYIDSDDFEIIRNQLLIELFYTTGIRRAELINIKLVDINFIDKTLKVLGKRNKERIIPLLDDVVSLIEKYINLRKEQETRISNLFITKKGKQIYDSLVYKIVNTYFSEVSSKTKKSPHVLRHAFATHMIDKGADLNTVKEILGHASLASTQVYTHSSLAHLKDVYKKSHPRNKKKA